MKLRHALLFLSFSIGITLPANSATLVDSDLFFVTISKKLLYNKSLQGILFSNEKGEWLNYVIMDDVESEEDYRIEFKKQTSDKVLISLFYNNKATTYVNIENGTYIDSYFSGYRSQRIKNRKSMLYIKGVNNVEDFKNFSEKNYEPESLEVKNGTYSGFFHYTTREAIYCLIQSNGEKRYRYFYEPNDLKNGQRNRARFRADYLDMEVCTNYHRITLPKKGLWNGKIQVQLKNNEKPFSVFNEEITEDSEETNIIQLPLPTGQFDYSIIKLYNEDFMINKIFNGIPKLIPDPNIEVEIITADEERLEFNTSKNVGFYTAKFLFMDDDSNSDFPIGPIWTFLGIDQSVSFNLPTIPEDILNKLPDDIFSTTPTNLTLTNYNVENEDTYDSWILPHTLLDKNWQTESGLIGKINHVDFN